MTNAWYSQSVDEVERLIADDDDQRRRRRNTVTDEICLALSLTASLYRARPANVDRHAASSCDVPCRHSPVLKSNIQSSDYSLQLIDDDETANN